MDINVAQILIIVIYLFIIALLGYMGYSRTKSDDDYLIGGREIHPAIMALSYGSTFISTSAIVGFGGNAALFGISLLWLAFLNIALGVFVAFVAFGKRTRRMGHNLNAHTFPELLGKRFDSKFIQKFSGTVIFLFMPIYTAAVTIGVSKILENTLGINYNVALLIFSLIVALYVFFGGIKGIMYSDAFQGGLMIIGMSILAVVVYSRLGGITSAHQKLTDLFNNPAIADQIEGLKAGGFRGWTSMPEFLSTYWWIIVSSITLGVGIGVLAQPQLAVRFMMVKSDKELNRAVPIGATFILLTTCTVYVIGALSNVLFFEETGMVAVAAAGGVDAVIPTFLEMFMPEWFTTIFLIVLMAAGMSTISSQFHAIGTAFGHDMFNVDKSDERKALMISRIGVLVAIIFTIILAYILPNIWDGAIAISTGLFFGLCAAAFLPMYIGALYCKNLTKTAAISSMLSGFISATLWMTFVHSKESKVIRLCSALFGKDTLAPDGTKWAVVDPICIALTISIIVIIAVQMLSKKKEDTEHIDKCYEGIR